MRALLHTSETTMKEFNPHWPFPQYDDDGRQLLPPGFNARPTPAQRAAELIDNVGEAML
jgi:hypothetical protein